MAVEPFLGTKAQRAFIATITFQAIVVLVMVAVTFRFVGQEVKFDTPRYKTLPCYLALFAFAELFELLMAFDGLRLRNIIQLLGILIFHAALVVFAALQVEQTRMAVVWLPDCDASEKFLGCGGKGTLWRKVQPLVIVAPCVIALSLCIMMFWVKELYGEFGWAIFHVVGANPQMKSMYQWYQIMICLLKFDFFFFVGVTMQLLIVVLSSNSAEFAVTIAAIPIVLALLAFCGVAVKREIKWLMSVSLVLMLAALSYFLYKLVRFYEPSSRAQYLTTRATLTIFTIVAFLLLFATFGVGLRCFADFDRGLLASKTSSVPTRRKYLPSGDMAERTPSLSGGAGLERRISIE